MNRLEFEKYVSNPMLMTEVSIAELKLLTETYPWFQSGYLLYAKALNNINHSDYYSFLKKTSILVSDRKALYQLINKKSFDSVATTAIDKKEEYKVISAPEEKKEILTKKNEDEISEIVLTSNSYQGIKNTDIVIEKVDQAVEPEKKKEKEERKKIELIVSQKEEKIIEKSSESGVRENNPETIAPATLNRNTSELNLNEVIINPIVNAYIEKELLQVTDIHKPLKKEETETRGDTEKRILTATLNEPHSFTEWLKLLAGKKGVETQNKPKAAPPIEEKPDDPLQKEERTRKQAIMDKLIQNEPGHIRIKESAEFFTPSKHARESNKEDETLVTETLAWIYEQQGNFSKAIRSYQILSLKFPEKSVYFAGLIQKIKIKQKEK